MRTAVLVAVGVLLVGGCGVGLGDQDGPAVAGQDGAPSDAPRAAVTAPPALRTADAPASSVPASGSTENAPASTAAGSTTDDEPRPSGTAGDTDGNDGAGPAGTATGSPVPQTSAPSTDGDIASLAETRFDLVPVAEVDAPVALIARPGSGQRYVATLTGQVWLLDPTDGRDDNGGVAAGAGPQLVADIGSKVSQGCENGLLGFTFSPDGEELYLSYTDTARNSRIAVMPMAGEIPQTGSSRILLALEQPACNHNGGDLAFGPDGNLWIGFGDGGGADDIYGQGQDRDTLLGAMLRIDPDPPSGRGYGIPAGNPFPSGSAPEAWAYGARNPWRFSFDRRTGDLWIADVGQNRVEEIHVLPAAEGWLPGANLGWPLFEGNERFSGSGTPADLVFPVYTYTHDDGCSVTGGYVYRGSAIAALEGAYVFGDYCTGELWGLVRGPDGQAERIDLGVSVPRNSLVSFGEDADGELYALSTAGTVYRLVAAP